MKHLPITFFSFFLIVSSSWSQLNLEYSLEYTPHFSHIINLPDYNTHKISHSFTAKAYFPVSSDLKFTFGIGTLNTGSREDTHYQPYKKVRNYNYAVLSLGTKVYHGKLYMSPEVGLGVFLYQSLSEHYEDRIEKEITSSYDLDYDVTVKKTSILAALTLGHEIQVLKKKAFWGIKGYVFLEQFAKVRNKSDSLPYGFGLNFGLFI